MEPYLTYGFGLLLLVIGLYFGKETWTYLDQYRTISSVDPEEPPTLRNGETGTVFGRAQIEDPVAAFPPGAGVLGDVESTDADDVDTGLLMWRLRRRKLKRRSSGSGSRRRHTWVTEDAGLEVGDFRIESDNGLVDVDSNAVSELMPGGFGTPDPWESHGLHLGDPDEQHRLDEARDIGPDLPIDISIGGLSSGERTRLEVNRIDEGDKVVVHGEITETNEGVTLTNQDGGSLVVATGSIGEVVGELRAKIAKSALITLLLVIFTGAMFAGFTDRITTSI